MDSRSSGRRLAEAVADSLGVAYDPTFAERVLEAYGMLDIPAYGVHDEEPQPVQPWTAEELADIT